MKTLRRKILHIFEDPDLDRNLRNKFEANDFAYISEIDHEKAIDCISYEIGIILVSGKLLRREMPVFFQSFKNSLFNKIPAIAIISEEEEEFYKKSILNLGFNDYISGKSNVKQIIEYVIGFLKETQTTRDRLERTSIAIIDDERLHAEAFQMIIEAKGLSNTYTYESSEAFLDSPPEMQHLCG